MLVLISTFSFNSIRHSFSSVSCEFFMQVMFVLFVVGIQFLEADQDTYIVNTSDGRQHPRTFSPAIQAPTPPTVTASGVFSCSSQPSF